jgi:hypothetical protein
MVIDYEIQPLYILLDVKSTFSFEFFGMNTSMWCRNAPPWLRHLSLNWALQLIILPSLLN